MEPVTADSDLTLPEFLRVRAQGSTTRRLALDITGGAAIALSALWARPTGWALLASAASCVALYGLWAVAERHVALARREGSAVADYAWFFLRTSAAAVGTAVFLLLLFMLLGTALGTWIS